MNITETERKLEQELWGKERSLHNLQYPAEEVIRFLKANCKRPQGKIILDFGCGNGRNTIPMVDMGFEKIIAMDYNKECLELTREKTKSADNIDYIQNQRMEIPLADNSVDCIVAYGALFYFLSQERTAFAKEMYRVLRPGGIVLADFRGLEDELFGMGRKVESHMFLLDERAGALQNMVYWFCNGKDLYQLYHSSGFTVKNIERKLQWVNNMKHKVDHYLIWLQKSQRILCD